MGQFFEKYKPYLETVRIIGTIISIATIVFSIGVFYNRFEVFENNMEFKFQHQEKILNGVTDQLDKRISNLEYINNNIQALSSKVQIVQGQLKSQQKLIQGNENLLKRNEISGKTRDSLTVIRDTK